MPLVPLFTQIFCPYTSSAAAASAASAASATTQSSGNSGSGGRGLGGLDLYLCCLYIFLHLFRRRLYCRYVQ